MDIGEMYEAYYIGFATNGIMLIEILAILAAGRVILNILDDSTRT